MRRSEAIGSKHSHNDAGKKDSDDVTLPPGSTSKINVDDKKINTVDRNENITRTVNATTVATAPSHKAPSSMVSIIDRIYSKKLDKKYDRKLLDQITNDVILQDLGVSFHDIAGNDVPKRILNEAVVLPLLIPEFFTGIRQPWKVFFNSIFTIICMDDLWLE
jgi:katanin p60 ATPase-containing subunit A1